MLDDLNISVIKYFIKVADIKNMTRAAEELYVSQSTLSRQITGLEATLGVRLLTRVRSGMELTDKGLAFYEQCKKLVVAYEEFTAKAFEFRNIVVGKLKVGYQATSRDYIFQFNANVLKSFPLINIQSIRQGNENFLDEVVAGNLDLAYVYGNELKSYGKTIESIRVGSLKKMLMISRENPLAKMDKLHLSDLKNEKFVSIVRKIAPVKTDEFFQACKQCGFIPNVAFYADTVYDILINVVTYNTVSILPYTWGNSELLEEKVKYVEIEGLDQEYPIHLAWLSSNINPVVPIYVQQTKTTLKGMSPALAAR